jgi:preprotein translocase subunit SecG
MLYYLSVAIYVLVCLFLLLVVLLQQGKGGDMASAFGGGGSQTAFGARAGATVLTRATTVLGVLFMIGAIVLGIIGRQGPGSIMSGVGDPAPQAPQTTPAPAATTPTAPVEQPSTPAPSAPAPGQPK